MKIVWIWIFLAFFIAMSMEIGDIGENDEVSDAKEGEISYIALIKVKHPHTGSFMPICAGAMVLFRKMIF